MRRVGLDAPHGRVGVRGERYNEHHLGLVGR